MVVCGATTIALQVHTKVFTSFPSSDKERLVYILLQMIDQLPPCLLETLQAQQAPLGNYTHVSSCKT